MSGVPILAWIGVAIIAIQGLVLTITPQRGAAMTLWQYKLIGARPAPPGPRTFLFFRLIGVAMLLAVAYTVTHLPE